jgi:hypothetical protein
MADVLTLVLKGNIFVPASILMLCQCVSLGKVLFVFP